MKTNTKNLTFHQLHYLGVWNGLALYYCFERTLQRAPTRAQMREMKRLSILT